MIKKTLVAMLVLAAATGLVAPRADAAPPTTGNYCVLHVIGQKPSGELKTSAPRCYDTFERSMQAEGVQVWGEGASVRAAAIGALSFTIGVHCDGYNLAAPCTSTVGDACTGGWLNTSAFWNNKISSTQHGCPFIGHYDGANLTGSAVITAAPGVKNLTTFNNRTSSIQYF